MKIRTKLTLTFFLVVIFILSIVTVSIHFFFANYRQNDFYRRLKNRAINTATLITEGEEEGAKLLRRIESRNPVNLPKLYIFVFNNNTEQLYSTENDSNIAIDTSLLNRIKREEEVKYHCEGLEVIGFRFIDKSNQFIVVAAANDVYGYNALHSLRNILLAVFAVSVVLVSISGWFYAGRFLSPISKIIKDVENITEANLDLRLNEGNRSDEIDKLSQTFNSMLERLEESFVAQKNFISNASHELRTPIAVISAEIEAALVQTDGDDQNYEVLISVLENTKSLSKLSTQLLLLAQTSTKLPDQKFSSTRVDEILWDAKNDLEKANPDYNIIIDFDLSLNEETFLIEADSSLIKIVFSNLMDNGCKYADDNQVIVTLAASMGNLLRIEFTNSGKGIEKEDLQRVFGPFFRGKNTKQIKGYGIGLPLAKRIMKLHSGSIGVESSPNSLTKFILLFPISRIS